MPIDPIEMIWCQKLCNLQRNPSIALGIRQSHSKAVVLKCNGCQTSYSSAALVISRSLSFLCKHRQSSWLEQQQQAMQIIVKSQADTEQILLLSIISLTKIRSGERNLKAWSFLLLIFNVIFGWLQDRERVSAEIYEVIPKIDISLSLSKLAIFQALLVLQDILFPKGAAGYTIFEEPSDSQATLSSNSLQHEPSTYTPR